MCNWERLAHRTAEVDAFGGGRAERKGEAWLVGTGAWEPREPASPLSPDPLLRLPLSFLGRLYSCQAGIPGRGEGREQEAVCGASLGSLEVFQSGSLEESWILTAAS